MRKLANSFPADTPAEDIVAAVEAKAEALGLTGVSVKQYSRRTRQRDEQGKRRTGVMRTPTGKVQIEYAKTSNVGEMNGYDKRINEINREIDDVLRKPMTEAELDSVMAKYLHGGKSGGDKIVVAKLLANQRSDAIKSFMRNDN